jgi:hypothetical protein
MRSFGLNLGQFCSISHKLFFESVFAKRLQTLHFAPCEKSNESGLDFECNYVAFK